jgi:hypothetical protein
MKNCKHFFIGTLVAFICSFFFSFETSAQILNNGKLRIGNGSEASVFNTGNLRQPFYWNAATNSWRQLTFSTRSLDNAFGVGGVGTNEWNINGEIQHNPVLSSQVINTSNYISTGPSTGYGRIVSTGTITINGQLLEITNTYTLPQNSAYITVTVKVKNLSATTMQNVRVWIGTGDDWVGSTDQPTKVKGNLVNGSFVAITNQSTRASAVQITSGSEGVLFYTNSPRGNSGINYCCSFSSIVNQDPTASAITLTNDGSYGFYVRMNDLAVNATDEFTWYYAAGELANLDDIINEVATASGAVQNISYTSAVLNATTSVNSNGYWMVVPRNSTAPTAAQIKAGTNYGAVTVVSSGSGAMTANVQRAFNLTGLTAGTNYDVYFVSQDASNAYSTVTSVQFTTLAYAAPTVSTNAVSGISENAASSGGNVTVDGGQSVTARGVCWSTSPNPTIASNKTINGSGLGNFSSSLSGLITGTTYYVRAYATNSVGTAYGNQVSFTTSADVTPPVVSAQNVTVQLNSAGQASIVTAGFNSTFFTETFNSEPGVPTSLTNWNFSAPGMDVDLGDYIPGNGSMEIDLAGYSNATITSKRVFRFVPGQYTLTFDNRLNDNPAGGNSVKVTIGSLVDQTFVSYSTATSESVTFTVTQATSAAITFEQLGANDAAGSFIGNIKLSRVIPQSFSVLLSASDANGLNTISVSKSSFDCTNLGSNVIQLVVTDAYNNATTTPVTVNVTDVIRPVLSPGANQDLNLNGSCTITVPDVRGTATDNCSVTITQSPAAGSVVTSSHNGVINVTVTATDPSNNTDIKTVVLTAKDVTAPAITCPADITRNTDVNQCGAVVTYTLPEGIDNCSGGAFNYFNSGEPNNWGSEDYLQLYNSATWNDLPNGANNRSLVEFNYITNATFANYTKIGDFGGHSYYFSTGSNSWTASRAAAQAIGADLASINTLEESQFLAPYGGNTWVGGYQDHSDPDYAEPGNASQNWGGWKWVDGTRLGAGQIVIQRTAGFASGTLFPKGVTTVTHTATDQAGNVNTCSFTVTVTDNQAPVLTPAANQNVNLDASCSVTIPDVRGTASDNCGILNIIQSPAAGTVVSASHNATINVTVTATDVTNIPTTRTVVLTAKDVTAPVLAPAANQNINLNGSCAAIIPDVRGTATDNCAGAVTITQSPAIGAAVSSSHNATINITVTATDAAGLTNVRTVVLTAKDVTAPVLTPAANQNVNIGGSCDVIIPDVRGTATDNCSGVTITQSPAAGTVVTSAHNQTINVTVTATDAAGLTNVRTVVLTAKDVTAPVLTPAANQNLNVNGSCSIVIPDVRGTATDNCSGVIITQNPAVGTAILSSHNATINVTVTATDAAGLTNVRTVVLTAKDVTPPSITCPAPISVSTDPNTCGATVTYALPSIIDNCTAVPVAATQTFNYTGTVQPFIVPAGVTSISVEAWGAQGGGSQFFGGSVYQGGKGGYAKGTLSVTPGSTIYLYVGQQGQPTTQPNGGYSTNAFNGGGKGFSWFDHYGAAGGGGGASDIRIGGNALQNRMIVAAGGGGATSNGCTGGAGGGLTGLSNSCGSNTGGSQVSGGSGGFPGGLGFGGDAVYPATEGWVGGGGGGYYGGGSGISHLGGAGGSSYIGGVSNGSTTMGVNNGNGRIVLSWEASAAIVPVLTSGLPSGSVFPVGTTTVTYQATDAAGLTSTCSFDVTVTDNQKPVITTNGNKSVVADAGRCDAVVNVSATATDNCTVGAPTGVRSDNLSLNAPYPVGTTTITWNVTDVNGVAALPVTQTVTVSDNQRPVITGMPGNITRNALVNNCLALITWAAPTATDNCTVASFSSSDADYNQLGYTLLPVGVHTITYTATDIHGNETTASFTVTVVDNQRPIVTGCPAPITVSAAAGTCGKQVFWNPPTASDNCPGVMMTGNHVSGDIFPVGTTTVTYTATDAVGLTTTCSFDVVVTDNEKPVISNCPQNITVNTGTNSTMCSQTATWTAPTATDNCGGVSVTASHQPGATFAVGTTTVTYTFTDVHNNVNTCSFNVTVVDNTAPQFGLSGDVVYLRSNTSQPWGLNGNEKALTAIYGSTGWKDYRYETVNTAQLFSSSTRFIFMEGGDGTANEMRNFLLANQSALENWVSAGGKAFLNAAPNEGGNINFGFGGVTLVYPDYTTVGVASVPTHPIFDGPNTPVGTSWMGSSLGHAIITPSNLSMTKLIHNTDNNRALLVEANWGSGKVMFGGMTLPFFQEDYGAYWSQPTTGNLHKNMLAYLGGTGGSNQQNIVKSNDAGQCGAVVTYNTPTATDNCPGVTVAQTSGLASGSLFPVGVTTNTFVATDAAGNTTTYSFTVTVNDVQAPTISCPSNINSIATSAAGAVVNYTTPVGVDNCSSTTVMTSGLASGSTFSIGETIVTYQVTDASGLTAQCSFTITVVGVPPSIVCPQNIVVSNNIGQCETNVSFTATETQAIPASTIRYSHQPGSSFPVGTTVVTATATNPVGTSVCTFTVTVNDTENPKLVGVPANTTVECNAVPQAAVVTATDNCSGLGAVQYAETTTPGSCAGNYTLTRTWSVTDAHNNSTSATQVITVVDTQSPTVTAPASNQTVECDGNGNTAALQAWLTNNGGATATDACSGVSWTNDFAAGNWVVDCGGAKHITVVFTATDACGNSSETTATFRIKDETAPAVATAAGSLDITLECSDAAGIAAAIAMSPSPTDDCSRVTIHLVSDVTTSGCGTTYRRVRQWNFTDECGNTSATFTQTINTKDETAPQITCPASVTVNCQDDSSPAATGEATATDNCSTPVVSYNDVSTQSADINNRAHYNYTITRTWTAVDACNNVSTCVQTITVQDVTKPVITCPANATVNCQDDNTSASNGKATATDNCGPVAITETQTSTQSSDINSAAHYNYVITRTWRATDVTGNYTECVQTITVQDITKPVAVCKPVTITLVNGSASIVATDVNGGSTDNCSPLRYTVSKSSFNCSNIGANTVTLTVTDVSGNVSTCQATVNVVGEIPTCKITSVPTSNVYTGGNPTSLYLGYGAQSTELSLDVPASGAPYTFSWSGNGSLSSTTVQSPLFAPTTAGVYTFTVFITNKYGCTTSCTISICVTDIRVMNARTGTWDGKKVYVCHVPPGNPGNSNTLEISVNAVPSHIGAIGHGTDRLGKCEVPVCTAPVYARGGAPTETTPAVHASYIKAYPNPTTGVFALLLQNYSKGKIEVQVVDNYGKLVANQSVTVMNQSENVTIDVTKHASGTYHVRVISADGVKTLRVVVAR